MGGLEARVGTDGTLGQTVLSLVGVAVAGAIIFLARRGRALRLAQAQGAASVDGLVVPKIGGNPAATPLGQRKDFSGYSGDRRI